jgi:hypothetical protein
MTASPPKANAAYLRFTNPSASTDFSTKKSQSGTPLMAKRECSTVFVHSEG